MVNTRNFIERNIMNLMPKPGHKEREKIIYYLKLYHNLVMGVERLKTRRGFDHLRVVAHMTKEESYAGEAYYLKYINSLARNAISNKKKIQRILAKDPAADPLHSFTELLMAQNICLLRILKISKV